MRQETCRGLEFTLRDSRCAQRFARVDAGVETGERVRIDSTVTGTHILEPADRRLLYDGVRVLTRSLAAAREQLGGRTRWRSPITAGRSSGGHWRSGPNAGRSGAGRPIARRGVCRSRRGDGGVAGRHGLTCETILRCAVLKHMRQETCRGLEFTLRDSRCAQRFAPVDAGVETGERVRIDSTVTGTHILEPADSRLLYDGVRVLTRSLAAAREQLGGGRGGVPRSPPGGQAAGTGDPVPTRGAAAREDLSEAVAVGDAHARLRRARKPCPPHDPGGIARAPRNRCGPGGRRTAVWTTLASCPQATISTPWFVDWLGSHPYQAEVLLFTLEAFANVPRRQMVVQCTDRVSDDVIAKLSAQGYTVTTIAPYLDQAYCNKIAQLDYFVDSTDSPGVFLLDLDLAILAELDIPDRDVVCGKLVDGANPPLDTLERLFDAAGIELPAIMPSDWEGRGDTIATNLNGGFLYVPQGLHRSAAQHKWRHWAEFLFAKPDLFDHPSARKHIDQIAFAMALASARIPFRHLPTNWNYPGHKDRVPRGYRRDEPLRVLHYHDRLGRFGLIDAAEFDGAALEDAVHRVNSVLAARDAPIPVL